MMANRIQQDTDYLDIDSLFGRLKENRWFIISVTMTIFLLSCIYSWNKPARYQVTTLLQVQQKNTVSNNSKQSQALDIANLPGESVPLQIALIRSRLILDPVINKLGLDIVSHKRSILHPFTITESKKTQTEIERELLKNLSIIDLSGTSDNPTSKITLLQIALIGENPQLITSILNQIVETTKQKSADRKIIQAETNLNFLNQQLPQVQQSLQEAIAALNHYRIKKGRIDLKLQTQYILNHLADIDKQLEAVKIKKSYLAQQFTLKHPFVIAINQKISRYQTEHNQLLAKLRHLPAADKISITLERDVNVKSNLYIQLLNQIRQLELIKAGAVSDITILSKPTVPEKPLPKNFSIIALASLLVGFLLSCALVLAYALLDKRINDSHWLEKTWIIRNLATIPISHGPALNAINDLHNLLRFNLRKASNNILTFIGLTKGVGKTFISIHYAKLLARLGHQVLIIDADLRNGHMHQSLGLTNNNGLVDILSGSEAITQTIQSTSTPGLDFLSKGTTSGNSMDWLLHDVFNLLLIKLSEKYDYVIVNTPASINAADVLSITKFSGLNLLVLGAGCHYPKELNIFMQNLNYAGISLEGSVFNHSKH